jgi:hypothetical protein
MGAGRRDFGQLNAKLEKHIERLPDYAQRAQEKLQRYFPPPHERRPGAAPVPPAGQRPVSPLRQLRVPPVAAALPVVAEVRTKWARWNEPAARLGRQKRRTSRALSLWIVLTILSGLWALAGFYGLIGATEGFAGAFGGISAAVLFAVLGVRSGIRLHGLHHTEIPAATVAPPLPGAGSAARAPMVRLGEAEGALAELLRQLGEPTSLGTTAVPEVSVEDARATAGEAAAALRRLALRVQSIERARAAAPAAEGPALDSAIATLREQLDDGVEGYGVLVAAAGRAVAASSGGVATSREALTDATDHLAGLAIALRELS